MLPLMLPYLFTSSAKATTFPEGQAKNEWKSYIVSIVHIVPRLRKLYPPSVALCFDLDVLFGSLKNIRENKKMLTIFGF